MSTTAAHDVFAQRRAGAALGAQVDWEPLEAEGMTQQRLRATLASSLPEGVVMSLSLDDSGPARQLRLSLFASDHDDLDAAAERVQDAGGALTRPLYDLKRTLPRSSSSRMAQLVSKRKPSLDAALPKVPPGAASPSPANAAPGPDAWELLESLERQLRANPVLLVRLGDRERRQLARRRSQRARARERRERREAQPSTRRLAWIGQLPPLAPATLACFCLLALMASFVSVGTLAAVLFVLADVAVIAVALRKASWRRWWTTALQLAGVSLLVFAALYTLAWAVHHPWVATDPPGGPAKVGDFYLLSLSLGTAGGLIGPVTVAGAARGVLFVQLLITLIGVVTVVVVGGHKLNRRLDEAPGGDEDALSPVRPDAGPEDAATGSWLDPPADGHTPCPLCGG